MRRNQKLRRSGSVLILSLWALLLLSAALFAWLKYINQSIAVTGQRNNGLEAKALAHSGVMVALNQQVTLQTPLLNQQLATDRGYKVQMSGEGGRLDLNWIFALTQAGVPADQGRVGIFMTYLQRRGLNIQQQNRLRDCILDWLTPGNIPRLNGAKAEGSYQPPGRGSFVSVEELALVKGSQPLVSQAGWEDDFTIFSPKQGVELQSASLRILECLPGIGESNAVRFLKVRQGPDGIDGTADDHAFANTAEALSTLGVAPGSAQAAALGNYANIENPPLSVVHIKSTGQCGNVYRQVEVVANRALKPPNILSWKEL